MFEGIDSSILLILRDMQYYARILNSDPSTTPRRPDSEFHNIVCSFQYRLLEMQGTLENVLSECLRLALLAFLVTTFQYPAMRASYPYLTDRFREGCRAVEIGDEMESRNLMRWLLIIGAISVFDVETEPEEWIRERWRTNVDDIGWEDSRAQLKDIMWVDALQDTIGKKAFAALNKQ